jgi:hypothetical protein
MTTRTSPRPPRARLKRLPTDDPIMTKAKNKAPQNVDKKLWLGPSWGDFWFCEKSTTEDLTKSGKKGPSISADFTFLCKLK